MRTPSIMLVWLSLLLFSSGVVRAAEAPLRVTEMAVTTKIVKGNPIDSVSRISSTSVKALYCFTRISAPQDTDTSIKHVWYRNEVMIGDSTLPVKGEHWRTFSKRPIDRDSVGEWRVDALDSDGKLLKSVKFRIN